jgi:hypothetical protein
LLTVGGAAGFGVVEHLVVDDAANNKVVLDLVLGKVVVGGPEAAEDQLAGALLGRQATLVAAKRNFLMNHVL